MNSTTKKVQDALEAYHGMFRLFSCFGFNKWFCNSSYPNPINFCWITSFGQFPVSSIIGQRRNIFRLSLCIDM